MERDRGKRSICIATAKDIKQCTATQRSWYYSKRVSKTTLIITPIVVIIMYSLDTKQPSFRIVFKSDMFVQYVLALAETRTSIDKPWRWIEGNKWLIIIQRIYY
jgi:hypothetical protein